LAAVGLRWLTMAVRWPAWKTLACVAFQQLLFLHFEWTWWWWWCCGGGVLVQWCGPASAVCGPVSAVCGPAWLSWACAGCGEMARLSYVVLKNISSIIADFISIRNRHFIFFEENGMSHVTCQGPRNFSMNIRKYRTCISTLEFPKSKTESNHYLPLCDFLNNCVVLATSLLINPQRNIMTI
jgi:hypothetical protein